MHLFIKKQIYNGNTIQIYSEYFLSFLQPDLFGTKGDNVKSIYTKNAYTKNIYAEAENTIKNLEIYLQFF